MKVVGRGSEKEVKPTKGSLRLLVFFFKSPSKLEMTSYFAFHVVKGTPLKFLNDYNLSRHQNSSQSNSIFCWSDC